MSTETQPLHQIWSLATSTAPQNPPPPCTLDEYLINDLLIHRWGSHHISTLANTTPIPSTTSALASMFGCSRTLYNTILDVLHKRGSSVPQFPDIPAAWKDELAIDPEALRATMAPLLGRPIKEYIEYADRSVAGEKHWTSLVAMLSVMPDLYMELVMTNLTGGEREGVSYVEAMMADETLGPYRDVMMSEKLAASRGALREEVMRLREEEKTGWNDEEAKEVVVHQVMRMREWYGM